MGWGKGKTEKGQGGKLGHSNRDGWGYHDEEKISSKKQRRLNEKEIILNEKSKVNQNSVEFIDQILQALNNFNLKFELHEFNSGAVMIDFWIETEFYCVQILDHKFGWTKANENTDFCVIPDSGYLNWDNFKLQFDNILSD